MPYCWRCKAPYTEFKKKPAFHAACDQCKSYWHSCCNCKFFTGYPTARCTVPNTDVVHDFEGANFCDEFQIADAPPGKDRDKDPHDLRRKWDELFKN